MSTEGDQHPLLRQVESLRLRDAAGEEPDVSFDPRGREPPVRPATPATLLALDGEAVEPGSLPATTGRRTAPPPPGVAETARRVAAGDLDPVELVEDALRRIAVLGPELGCFVTVTAEPARQQALRLRRTLAEDRTARSATSLPGVVLGHKDLIATAGVPTRAGSALLADCVPRQDAVVVAALRRAGTLSLGKLETHEFATGITGLVTAHPPVRNPWDPERVPGGSSCGSAVAVAAGLVSAATGTDTGGSIRIPAACCGVVGLKPTYGRVSRDGVIPFAWSLDHVGPLTRTVGDAGLTFAAMLGDPGTDAGPEPRPTSPEEIRFALPATFLERSTPRVADAVAGAAEELERLGARRVSVELPPEVEHAPAIAGAIFLAEGYAVHAPTLARHADEYCPETRAFLELGARVTAERYLTAQRIRARLRHGIATAMQEADVILMPSLPIVAPRIADDEVRIAGRQVPVRAALTRFTRLANLTGQPALSVPIRCGGEGLPVAIQVLGRPDEESRVLAVGALLEETAGGPRWPSDLAPDDGGSRAAT